MADPATDPGVAGLYDRLSRHFHLLHADWEAVVRRDARLLDGLIRARLAGFRSAAETRVLDCAAGIGTQSIGLFAAGYDIIACDASPESLETLQEHLARLQPAAAAQRRLATAVADFRDLPARFGRAAFDVVICFDNSLAHMLTPADLERALRSMAVVLKPGGLLLLSVRDYDRLRQERPLLSPPQPVVSDERIYFQVWRWQDDGTLKPQIVIVRADNQVLTWQLHLRALPMAELLQDLERLGFRAEVLDSDATGHPQRVIAASAP